MKWENNHYTQQCYVYKVDNGMYTKYLYKLPFSKLVLGQS